MTLNDYQAKAQEYAMYPKQMGAFYTVLGLTGEAGEVANKLKKIARDKGGRMSAEDIQSISKELGDVLWYIANLAIDLNIPLEKIAQDNLHKLSIRKQSNTLHGSGDNR